MPGARSPAAAKRASLRDFGPRRSLPCSSSGGSGNWRVVRLRPVHEVREVVGELVKVRHCHRFWSTHAVIAGDGNSQDRAQNRGSKGICCLVGVVRREEFLEVFVQATVIVGDVTDQNKHVGLFLEDAVRNAAFVDAPFSDVAGDDDTRLLAHSRRSLRGSSEHLVAREVDAISEALARLESSDRHAENAVHGILGSASGKLTG